MTSLSPSPSRVVELAIVPAPTQVQYTQTDIVRQTIAAHCAHCTDRQMLNRSAYSPLIICTSVLGGAYEGLQSVRTEQTAINDMLTCVGLGCTDCQRLSRSVYGW